MTRNWAKIKRNSGEIARIRLKHLLLSDKTNCSPELLDMMKEDMLDTLSRYLLIDRDHVELRIGKSPLAACSQLPVLYANIPISKIGCKGII